MAGHTLDYQAFPDQQPAGAPAGDLEHIQTSPEMFGGALGAAEQKLGQGVEAASGVGFAYQGMLNETLATDTETQYMMSLGKLKADYRSKEGLDAYNSQDQHVQAVANLRQQYDASLGNNLAARRAFNLLALRHEGYEMQDTAGYAAAQLKVAENQSSQSGMSIAIANAGNYDVASNPQRFQHEIDSIDFFARRIMQNRGYAPVMFEDINHNLTFEDSDQGRQAKNYYDELKNKATADAYDRKYRSLSDQNPVQAYDLYQKEKSKIPAEAQAKLDAYFTPKVQNFNVKTISDNQLRQAQSDYYSGAATGGLTMDMTAELETGKRGMEGQSNISADTAGSKSYGVLGLNSRSGSVQQFAKEHPELGLTAAPGTPEFDNQWRQAARDNTAALYKAQQGWYSGHIMPAVSRQLSAIPANIASDPSVVRYMADRAVQMGDVGWKSALEAAKDSQTPSQFIQNVSAADKLNVQSNFSTYLTGHPENLQGLLNRIDRRTIMAGQTPADGRPPISLADYYRQNLSSILYKTRTEAENYRPGDINFVDLTVRNTEARMKESIEQQNLSIKADNDLIYRAANGQLSNGKKPVTIDELESISPEVKSAFERVETSNPLASRSIQDKLTTNSSRGLQHNVVSNQSKIDLLHDLRSGADPEEVLDRAWKGYFTDPKTPGSLTDADFDRVRKEVDDRRTPEGAALAKDRDEFFKKYGPTIDGAVAETGQHSILGLQRIYEAEQDARRMERKLKDPHSLYDPTSPDFFGKKVMKYHVSNKDEMDYEKGLSNQGQSIPAQQQPEQKGIITIPAGMTPDDVMRKYKPGTKIRINGMIGTVPNGR